MSQIKQLKMEILTSIRYNPGTLEDLMGRDFIKGRYSAESIGRILSQLEGYGLVRFSEFTYIYRITLKARKELGWC